MRTLTLPLLAAPLLASAVLALDRHLRAARTCRQVVDVLAAVPELAGALPAGHADRVAALADELGERLDRDERRRVATVARLAHLDPSVAEAAGLDPRAVRLLEEVRAAPPGRAGPAAAAVRVATTFESRSAGFPTSGALFATLVEHQRGEERKSAQRLVRLVRMHPSRV